MMSSDGPVGGFAGITFDDSSGLSVQAPTVYVSPTLTPITSDWEPSRDREILLNEIRSLRGKIRNIPEEYLVKAGLTQTDIADIRNQSVTGTVWFGWGDITKIEGKIATAKALWERDKQQEAMLSSPTPVPATSTTTSEPSTATSTTMPSPSTPSTTSTTPSKPSITSSVVSSWASFRQYESQTSPWYVDDESRRILVERAWALPLLNRLIDVGLTIFDLNKIRDNTQMTWGEYREIERKIAEAERKAGIDSSEAIRRAQDNQAFSSPVSDFVSPIEREPEPAKPTDSKTETGTLIGKFRARCVIAPLGGMSRVTIHNPETDKALTFIYPANLPAYDGEADVEFYKLGDKLRIKITLLNGTVIDAIMTENDIIISSGESKNNWWIYLAIGVGVILVLILLAKR